MHEIIYYYSIILTVLILLENYLYNKLKVYEVYFVHY